MLPRETVCSGAEHPGTDHEIMQTSDGRYYVGFRDKDGMPYSRETVYVDDKREAVIALCHVTQELELGNPQLGSVYIRR